MSTSAAELRAACIESVTITDDTLSVDLNDGRTISVPLGWFPRLVHASFSELNNWSLIGRGLGVHWQEIDEDISVQGLLEGKPSSESQRSFQNWLEARLSH